MAPVMVVFSSVTLSDRLVDCALETARRDGTSILVVEIRSQRLPHRVATLTEERGFLGKEVVDRLERDISKERQDHIGRHVREFLEIAERAGIPAESIVLDRPSIRKIVDIAREREIRIIIAESRIGGFEDDESMPFEVIRVKE